MDNRLLAVTEKILLFYYLFIELKCEYLIVLNNFRRYYIE